MNPLEPAYLNTAQQGLLTGKAQSARQMLGRCMCCPRQCGVDRLKEKTGFCQTGSQAMVAAFHPHFGEEAPLTGRNGSGTIFFSHCNLSCNFCQNFDISHGAQGRAVTDAELAGMMISLQDLGCHNINLVTPSHVVPQILSALEQAVNKGLHIPLVYNSSAYDDSATLKLLDGVIDIYLPDFKFWDSEIARDTFQAPDYPDVARRAISEMHRQVGDLVVDDAGIARKGIIVRHLVLPYDLAGTRNVMQFIFKSISPHTYVNVMSQYRPCGRAHEISALSRALAPSEYKAALHTARQEGITRLDGH
ncbi:MAG: radical SAM protein [Desulfobacteraceae bacterium]|nr:MAG: radical SAM protein [Desulfobacteraceae bacterium]